MPTPSLQDNTSIELYIQCKAESLFIDADWLENTIKNKGSNYVEQIIGCFLTQCIVIGDTEIENHLRFFKSQNYDITATGSGWCIKTST